MSTAHLSAQIGFYDSAAEQIGMQWQRVHNRRRQILRQCVDPGAAKAILEIGCHGGEFLITLGAPDARRVGVDISPKLVERVRRKGVIDALCADATEGLKFSDATFDLIVLTEVIEHVIDTDALLHEILRLLVPGGNLLISTPNICSLKNRFLLATGRYPEGPEYRIGGAGHVRVYSAETLVDQLAENGFSVRVCTGLNLLPDAILRRLPLLDTLDRVLAGWFPQMCSAAHVVARRPVS